MSPSIISFVAWAVFMVLMLVALVVAARRGREIQNETEDVASRALPEIGGIAEKKHHQRFGRAATDAPGSSSNGKSSWYPEVKTKAAKQV
jgi:hypothetical protein